MSKTTSAPKRKAVEPGPVKISPVAEGEGRTAGYQASQVSGIALPSYFPKSADCLDWAYGDVIGDNSQIFIAGYINPHSQSFGSLAGKSPKIGPCLRVPQSVEPCIHGSRKIFPNWQHSWMLVSEPSPYGVMELLSAYVPHCRVSTSEELSSPGDGPDIGIISEAACS
ncbi:hypothetical protein OUZ56_025700 [Daphnia magna]|uniref:Uncharacterized protein n=1 Tax=Daphnia magna TaxID=35525 RepID=A0ABQ9ZKC4_9CRUS|nr:hypothetical protein OUZ56_025700 [Daphnia magna]